MRKIKEIIIHCSATAINDYFHKYQKIKLIGVLPDMRYQKVQPTV